MVSKDDLEDAQNQQNNDKETRSRRQFQEGSEAGRRSRIRERTASSKGKEAAAKAQGYAERVKSKDGLEREEKQL